MKITIVDKEYELVANGYYMKKYYDLFKGNVIIDMYKASEQKDIYTLSKLTYCAIENIDITFDEWLKSFDNPFFLLPYFTQITEYLLRDTEPTVKYTGKKESSKKKTTS